MREITKACTCKGCQEESEALQKQLDHKFYKDAETFRNNVKMETMKKAAQKYPEPFDPSKWTIEELAKHAMAENYDQQNYIYGMYERLQDLEKDVKRYVETSEYWFKKSQEKKELIGEQAAKIIRLESYQNHSQRKFSELGKVLRSCYPEKIKPGKHVVDTAIDLLNHKGQFIDERI